MPNSEEAIRALTLDVIDARQALADAILRACPGPHSYVQHRDGREPWCQACGYTAQGSRVTRP